MIPDNRPPLLWELLHTVPRRPESAQLCDDEITLMDALVPAFTTMHDNRGFLPTECIFAFAHQFSSDMFTGLYNVAEYTIWRSGQDQAPIYDWHRRMLQTLQHVTVRAHHPLGPQGALHLSALPLVFATYPDAKVVITHRDPLRVVGSLADMMATLHWMHSNHADHAILVEFLCMGLEMQMDGVTAQRDAGALPQDQISDVLYHDLIGDPLATVERLYAGWDLPISEAFRHNLTTYLQARHAHRTSGHDYSFADTGLDLPTHRANWSLPIMERFGVTAEVN